MLSSNTALAIVCCFLLSLSGVQSARDNTKPQTPPAPLPAAPRKPGAQTQPLPPEPEIRLSGAPAKPAPVTEKKPEAPAGDTPAKKDDEYTLDIVAPTGNGKITEIGGAPAAAKHTRKHMPAQSMLDALPVLTTGVKADYEKTLVGLIRAAIPQTGKYNQTFRDLSTQETRLSELFEPDGDLDKKRMVVCDFFVYQSRHNPDFGVEYRIGQTIDGKPVKQDDKRINKVFEKLLRADSETKELEIVNDEAFRHDLVPYRFYGIALHQWREIRPDTLASVGYEYAGRQTLDGVETELMIFQQTKANKWLEWELPWPARNLQLRNMPQMTRGALWLDTSTKQIRRAVREMFVILPGTTDPVLLWRQTLQFTDSAFAILVPRKFTFEHFLHIRRGAANKPESYLSSRLTSEFGTFKRFDVSAEEQDKKTILRDTPAAAGTPPKDKP
ncbi:MAG: hypothetical protein ACKV2V_20020 [Blastocatellia bacterium]